MILKISEIDQHIGEMVRVLDLDMVGIEGELVGVDNAYKYIQMLPFPIKVKISFGSLLVSPVIIHVATVELINSSVKGVYHD